MKWLWYSKRLIFLTTLGLFLASACQKNDPETPQIPVVTIRVDGEERQFQTRLETVGELLAEAGITTSDLDRVEPAEYVALIDGLVITVVRVRYQTEEAFEIIPYGKQNLYDSTVPVGESRIIEGGENGELQLVYRVVYEDGVEVERAEVRRIIVREPKDEIWMVGAREDITPTPITGTLAYLVGSPDVGFNAWVMRGSSAAQRRLTSEGDLDTRVFALSPDGTQLLYTRRTTETLANSQLNSLWLLDTVLQNAEPVDTGATNVLWAGWSPDGDRIAYSTGVTKTSVTGWQANNDLWTAQLNSQGRLTRRDEIVEPSTSGAYFWWGSRFAWSPDGRYIAYARADSVGVIRVRDGQQTELRRFAPYETHNDQWVWVPQLSWSPDSRFLTTIVHGPSVTGDPPEDSQVFDVWVLDLQSPLAVKQINEAGMWAAPTWSPAYTGAAGERASRIAYARAKSPYESNSSFYDLYVMDRDGSDRLRIYPADGELGLKEPQVVWAPNGTQLITVHRDDLFLIDLAQDRVRRLTLDASAGFPVWTQ